MKKIYVLIAISFIFLTRGALAVSFVDGHEDIPIMDGLIQAQNDSVSFGNEESRFFEAYLTGGKATYKEAETFYINTLPQLGWKFSKKDSSSMLFSRENEQMEIVLERNKPLLLRITIKSSD